MKRMTYLVMALALVLGLAQCKKEKIEPQNEGNSVMITLDVTNGNNNGSRAEVDPPHVNFENGDQILVASGGKYVGALTRENNVFSGSITDPEEGEPLYFYFLGNKVDVETLTPGATDECTVNISDQSNYPHLPVISMGKSNETYPSEGNFYSSRLYNKCSLMKFVVTTPSDSPICITGMNNEVTVDFGDPTDSGFTYGMNDTDGGLIKMAGGSGTAQNPAVKWAIVLPQSVVEAGDAYTFDGAYTGTRPAIEGGIQINTLIDGNFAFEVATAAVRIVNLSEVTSYITLEDGDIVTGTLDGANNADQRKKISIADGATITLSDAHILGYMDFDKCYFAGLTCIGDATIILDEGTTNDVQGFHPYYPGIEIPAGKTLTIDANGAGTGSLDVRNKSTGQGAAGIGGRAYDNSTTETCGNIVINGGVITATGAPGNNTTSPAPGGAGIGGGWNVSCGTITINGGSVTANGGMWAAGIGTSSGGNTTKGLSNCGSVTIKGGTVVAQGGTYAAGIGSGYNQQQVTCSCSSVSITGGKVTATGGAYGAGIGSGYASGRNNTIISYCGNISITGGTVTATGGSTSAGIGTGNKYLIAVSQCGDITIGAGVTSVTAEKGSGATNSIGVGKAGTCGTITVGGTVTGNISTSPYTYQP